MKNILLVFLITVALIVPVHAAELGPSQAATTHRSMTYTTATETLVSFSPNDKTQDPVFLVNGTQVTITRNMILVFSTFADPISRLNQSELDSLEQFEAALIDPEAFIEETTATINTMLDGSILGQPDIGVQGCAWELFKVGGSGVLTGVGCAAGAPTGVGLALCVGGAAMTLIAWHEMMIECGCTPCSCACGNPCPGEPGCEGDDDDDGGGGSGGGGGGGGTCECLGDPCLWGTDACCPGSPPNFCNPTTH